MGAIGPGNWELQGLQASLYLLAPALKTPGHALGHAALQPSAATRRLQGTAGATAAADAMAPACLPAWRPSDAPLPAHAAAGLHGCPSDALLPAHADGGELATAAEYERLAARLAALPTSEAEDQALLDGGTVTGALGLLAGP